MVSMKNNKPTILPISIEGAILATTKLPSPKAVSLTLDKHQLYSIKDTIQRNGRL